MPILVLQAFAVQCRTARCAAQQKPTGAHVTCCPREITDTLETEHRVVDVERDERQTVRAVCGSSCQPGGKRTSLGDAFLENLPILGFAVGGELVRVERLIELTARRVDTNLAKHPLHAKCPCLIGHDRHHTLTYLLVAQQEPQNAREYHRRRVLALTRACELLGKCLERGYLEQLSAHNPPGNVSAEHIPSFAQVGRLRRVLRRSIERYVGQFLSRQRNAKTIAKDLDRLGGQLLDLVRIVFRLDRGAHAVTLYRLRQNDRRLPGVLNCLAIGRIYLERIVPASIQTHDVIV